MRMQDAPQPTGQLREQDATPIVEALYRELVGREPDDAGLLAFTERLRAGPPGVSVPAVVREMTSSAEAARARVNAVLSQTVELALARRGTAGRPIVSLGTHCYTATLLQAAGLKTASYPFDWIFSSPGMVAHCLDDDFATFLNRRYYEPVPPEKRRDGPDVNLCDHRLYRDRYGVPFVFNHRDPLDDEDYQYLVRCVDRFRALARNGSATFLLATHDSEGREATFAAVSEAVRLYAPASSLVYVVVAEQERPVVTQTRIDEERDGHTLLLLSPGSTWRPLWFESPLDDMTVLAEALRRA